MEKKAKKKKDSNKEAVLAGIFKAVEESEVTIMPEQISTTKMSFMDAAGSFYTVTVTKHKGQPDGYTGGIKNKFAEKAEAEVE